MAITTELSKFFKQELLKGSHDFDAHTFRVALIKVGAARNYNKDVGSRFQQARRLCLPRQHLQARVLHIQQLAEIKRS